MVILYTKYTNKSTIKIILFFINKIHDKKRWKTYDTGLWQTFGSPSLRHWVTLTKANDNNEILTRYWLHGIMLYSENKKNNELMEEI